MRDSAVLAAKGFAARNWQQRPGQELADGPCEDSVPAVSADMM